MFVLARKKYAFNMVDYYLSKFEERLRTPYVFDIFKQKIPYEDTFLHIFIRDFP
ncbi:not available [Bacillus cereus]|jgi:hypothetical protein|nr:not available [Bacillus cereus]ASI81438.1 not available [Bacillus cereus]AVR30241.1 not available [Bacillus cereus]QBZ23418.1 not available [Bacillus cereus]UWJ19331.1 hypothetical protein FORC10_3242 [Bacillus cereus]